MRVRPRTWIAITAAVVLVCCLAGAASVVGFLRWNAVDTRGEVEFVNPLATPPLAPSHVDEQGRRVFDLHAAPGRHDFGDGPVATWGFDGDYLGPTLRAIRGEEVLVNVHNGLPEETTVHWHGIHLPAAMDGGPHTAIAPGTTWSPQWRVDQPAATLWYHPHPHGRTAEHVYRGLAGLFIIDDPATQVDALPHRYGIDDIPVVVQDKNFDGGELDFAPSLFGMGILGRSIVVNGTLAPYQQVTTERVRLRLLNGSNARVYQFAFADHRSFALVGTDGGLLAAPVTTDRVLLSPGERAEIVVTVRPGEQAVLRSDPPALGTPVGRLFGGADGFDVLELRAAPSLEPSPAVPDRLVEVPALGTDEATPIRKVRLTDQGINNKPMDMARIDATIESGATEVWLVSNADGKPHNFHIHGVSFQVRRVDGAAPPAYLWGWKDTIYAAPERVYELVVRFPAYPDSTIPYMYHCHILYHEDHGMMAQYVVVAPGQTAASLPASHQHHHG
ncbi:MAG: multicopper oxidase domain-containing protein [Dactylosporangium sp.]|nr:multicopper oxidase domain-containing protein [Dactylosporangium sp.]